MIFDPFTVQPSGQKGWTALPVRCHPSVPKTRRFNLTWHSGAYIVFLAKNIHSSPEARAHCALELPVYLRSWLLLCIGYFRETARESCLCEVTLNATANKKQKMMEDFSGRCVASSLILSTFRAKNRALISLFRVRLDCSIFRTLPWPLVSSTEAWYVFL